MQTQNLSVVKGEFSSYLSNPKWGWNWVVTQTFDEYKVPIHANIVRDSWNDFLREVGRHANVVYGWMFGERHTSGRPHWHAICRVDTNLFDQPRRKDIWLYMFDRYGRNRIEPFKSQQKLMCNLASRTVSDGIARYLTKYVAKSAFQEDATWDFGGLLSGCEADTKQIRAAVGL